MHPNDADLRRSFYHLGILTLAGALLYWARPVLIPITLAVLVVFVLAPLGSWLERRGLPRFLASVIAVAGLAIVLVAIGHVFVLQMTSLAEELPVYRAAITEKVGDLRKSVESSALADLLNLEQADKTATDKNGEVGLRLNDLPMYSLVQSIAGALFETVMVFVLALLMLMRREDLRNRTIYLLGSENLVVTTRAMDDASARISRFLFSQLVLNAGFGVVVAVGLYFIGIPYAYLFGALAGVLRYIPFLGGVIAALFPLLASLILPGWTPFFVTLAFFVAIELLQANLVEPLVFGHSIGISGAGQLMAALFWAALWGPIGLILSTPLIACLCVMGRHFAVLRFLALLMDDETLVDKPTTLYQRLLADDSAEASDLVEEFVKTHSPQEAIDDLLIPTLLAAQADCKQGTLCKDDQGSFTDAVRDLYYDVIAPQQSDPDAPEAAAQVLVLEFPFNDEVDDLLFEMLRYSSGPHPWLVETVKNSRLEGLSQIDDIPVVIVLATSARQNHGRIRGACRAVRKRFADAKILVCCWDGADAAEALRLRLQGAGANAVCTTFQEAQQFLERASAPSEPAFQR